jgi:DNA-binding protein H-NS
MNMARTKNLENMNHSELAALRSHIDHLMVEKEASEKAELREKMAAMAKDHGLSIDELFGKNGRRKGIGSVAVKYRDPKNPSNTWTGRGRMASWLVAATKSGKAKREDFLV